MEELRCASSDPEHRHLSEHGPEATVRDGCCQASTPLPPFHSGKAPAPAWARRTVAERRLRWLVSRHPKMNAIKRYAWAVRGSSEIKKG